MKISLHMLGDLRQYLPASANFDQADIEIAQGASLRQLIDMQTVPIGTDYIVIVNGQLVQEADFDDRILSDNDEVTLFPPIKGG